MKFKLTAVAALFYPGSVFADPVTVAASIASWVGANAVAVQIALTVASAAYGQYSARRAARKAEQAAKDAYNANLEDRTATLMTSTPNQRVVYGRAVAGGDVLAMFTTDKHGIDDNGNAYTKPDGLKHMVVHVASHQCQAFHDTLVAGVPVGAIDSNGWATTWSDTRTITVFGTTKLPYKATSILAATNGTTNYIGSVSLSADGRTLNAPAGTRIKVKYTCIRDDFCKGDVKTDVVAIAPGGSATVTNTPLSILDKWVYYTNGETGDAKIEYNLPDVPTVNVSGNTISNTYTAPGAGHTVYVRYTYGVTKSVVRLSYHLGAPGQTVDTYLNGLIPDKWTTDHKLEGLAWVLVTLDLEDQRFQGGPPQLSFDTSGRLLLDPRTGTTTWSNNAALVINDFLRNRWGYNCEADEVSQSHLIQAANDCDGTVSFTEVDEFNVSTTTTGPRYTINGAFSADENRDKVLDDMSLAMAGRVVDGPQWIIMAGVWSAPVVDISDDWLAGSISIVQCDVGLDEVFNTVHGTYIPLKSATVTEYGPYLNDVHVAADGEELFTDLPLPYTNSKARCMNIARIVSERMRTGLVISYPAKRYAWPLLVGERVRLTSSELGATNKTFLVTDWQSSLKSPVLLTLREDEPDTYDEVDSVKADPTINIQNSDPWHVEPVTNLQISSGTSELLRYDDGTVVVRARVSWSAPANTKAGQIQLTYFLTNMDGTFTTPVRQVLTIDDNEHYISGLNEGDRLNVKVVVVNDLGSESPSVFAAGVIVGKSAPPSNVTGVTQTSVPGGALVSWVMNSDPDHAATVIQVGSWNDLATPYFRGLVSKYTFSPGTDGSYTLYLKNIDTSGNFSPTPTSITVNVVTASQAAKKLTLSPSLLTLSVDNSGNTTGLSSAYSDAKVLEDNVDNTAAWTITKTDGPGVVSTLANNRVSVSSVFDSSVASFVMSVEATDSIGTLTGTGYPVDSSPRQRILKVFSGASASSLSVVADSVMPTGKCLSFSADATRSSGFTTLLADFFTHSGFSPDFLIKATSTFTFSAWINTPGNSSGAAQRIFTTFNNYSSITLHPMCVQLTTSNQIQVVGNANITSSSIPLNQWNHIEVTSTAGTLRLYVNGVVVGTTTTIQSFTYADGSSSGLFGQVAIGYNPKTPTSGGFIGKMSLIRVASTVLHTANFDTSTVLYTTQVGDSLAPYVVSHLNYNNNLVDETGRPVTGDPDTAYITDSTYGTGITVSASGVTGGAYTDYSSDFDFKGDFCIEVLCRVPSGGDTDAVILAHVRNKGDTRNTFRLQWDIPQGQLKAYYWSSSSFENSVYATRPVSNSVFELNRVYHVAMVRQGSNYWLFVDGRWVSMNNDASLFNWPEEVQQIRFGASSAANKSSVQIFWSRVTTGHCRYNGEFNFSAANVAPVTATYIDVSAKKGVETLTSRIDISRPVNKANKVVTSSLDRSTCVVTADYLGAVTVFTNVNCTVKILVNGVDDTSNWTITRTASSATITTTLTGATIAVTAFGSAIDTGYVDIFATRAGYPSQTLRFSMTKVKAVTPTPAFSVVPATLYVDAVAATGQILSYSGKTITCSVNRTGTDETASWTFTASATNGCTVSVSGAVISLTGMPNGTDTCTVNVTATRSGYQTMTLAPMVLKLKNQPTPGVQSASTKSIDMFSFAATGTAGSAIRFTKDGGIEISTDNGGTWTFKDYWYYPLTTDVGATFTIEAYDLGPNNLTTTPGGSVSLASTRTYILARSATGYVSDKLRFRVKSATTADVWVYSTMEANVA